MKAWVLFVAVILGILLFLSSAPRERLVITSGPGERPSSAAPAWRSKIDAQAPLGGNDEDYVKALQSFYDTIYSPLRTQNPDAQPKASEVEVFLDKQPATVDKKALRQIILSSFQIDREGDTGAAREEKQLNKTGALKGFQAEGGSQVIEPKDGVLETWKRVEETYQPSDSRLSTLPEGIYGSLPESSPPRREGVFPDSGSTSRSGARPYSLGQNVQ